MPRAFFRAYRLRPWVIYALILLLAMVCVFFLRQTYPKSSYVTSWALAGKVIVVDAGHGGFDPGVIGYSGAIEKDLNLQIAKLLAGFLREAGASVVMTRDIDTALAGNKQDDLYKRVDLAGENKADIFISIHCNALDRGSRWRGAQSFYYPENQEGKKLAEIVQQEMIELLGNTTRTALPHETTYILQNLKLPAAIIEVGFLSNPEEEKLLCKEEYQWQVAWAVYSGVAKYFTTFEHDELLAVLP